MLSINFPIQKLKAMRNMGLNMGSFIVNEIQNKYHQILAQNLYRATENNFNVVK